MMIEDHGDDRYTLRLDDGTVVLTHVPIRYAAVAAEDLSRGLPRLLLRVGATRTAVGIVRRRSVERMTYGRLGIMRPTFDPGRDPSDLTLDDLHHWVVRRRGPTA